MAKKGSLGGLGGAKRQPYEIAMTITGSVEGDAAVKDFLETGGLNLDPETTAWCAAFVNSALAQAGLPQAKNPLGAQSLLDYGEPVLSPQKGDIAVFGRDPEDPDYDPSLGHASFYMGEEYPGYVDVLGGNQGEFGEVGLTNIDEERLLGYRRPPGIAAEPEAQSLAASLPPTLASGIYRTDLSRNLNPAGTVAGLPGGLGGTITPRLEESFFNAVNMPAFDRAAEEELEEIPQEWLKPATLWPKKRSIL